MRTLLLLLLLPLIACPPVRNGGDDDDDATATDDDDATADDDDDTGDDDDTPVEPPPDDDDDDTPVEPPPDDDDSVEPDICAEPGSSNVWFDASLGTPEGVWFEGDITWDGSQIHVTAVDGTVTSVSVISSETYYLSELFAGFWGSGRMMVAATSWGAWTANGVLGLVDDDTGYAVALGSNSTGVDAMDALGFELDVNPAWGECDVPLFDQDGCGPAAALPMWVELVESTTAEFTTTWPDSWNYMGSQGLFRQYHGWQLFELLCDDFDSPGYSWTFQWGFLDVDG